MAVPRVHATTFNPMDNQLRTSLAMLDSQLASLHELGAANCLGPLSPRMSAAMDALERAGGFNRPLGPVEPQGERDNRDQEQGDQQVESTEILSASPTAARSPSRASVLWEALGFDKEHGKTSPVLNPHQHNAESISLPSADSIASFESSMSNLEALAHLRPQLRSLPSSSSASSDDFDISEFPSYSDLSAFHRDHHGSTGLLVEKGDVAHETIVRGDRSSNLLEFPHPPLSTGLGPIPPSTRKPRSPEGSIIESRTTTSSVSYTDDEQIGDIDEGDFTREEARVFDELARLGGGSIGEYSSGSKGAEALGLGLHDARTTPYLLRAPSRDTASPSAHDGGEYDVSPNASTLDLSRSSEELDSSASYSLSTHEAESSTTTTRGQLSSADTSFVASSLKENDTEAATLSEAASLPQRSVSLPMPTATPRPAPAKATLQNLPEILRTRSSPPNTVATQAMSPMEQAQPSIERASPKLAVDVIKAQAPMCATFFTESLPSPTCSAMTSVNGRIMSSKSSEDTTSPAMALPTKSIGSSLDSPPVTTNRPSIVKRLSMGILKKRKSEAALATLASQSSLPGAPLTKPATLGKRSISTPRLSSAYKGSPMSPPLPTASTTPRTTSSEYNIVDVAGKANGTKQGKKQKRLSLLLLKSIATSHSPITDAYPLSAPPTTTTFGLGSDMNFQRRPSAETDTYDHDGGEVLGTDLRTNGASTTRGLGFFDYTATSGLASPVALSFSSPYQKQTASFGSPALDSSILRFETRENETLAITSAVLVSGKASSISSSVVSTPILDGSRRFLGDDEAGYSLVKGSGDGSPSESLTLAGFMRSTRPPLAVKVSPVTNDRPSAQSDRHEDLVQRPARSSSFFGPSSSPIFPQTTRPAKTSKRSPSPRSPFSDASNRPFGDRHDQEPPSPVWSNVSPMVSAASYFAVPDIVAFPMSTAPIPGGGPGLLPPGAGLGLGLGIGIGQPGALEMEDEADEPMTNATRSAEVGDEVEELRADSEAGIQQGRDAQEDESAIYGASEGERDSDDGDEDEDEDDEDDKPLGAIPGALSAQKSIRQESRRARKTQQSERKAKEESSGQARGRRRDPFEFDPAGSSAAIGHSLLPQTDDAVRRRSESVPRSPSMPLDPVVAESTLTMDSPEMQRRMPQPFPPPPQVLRAVTMPLPPSASSSRENVPRRPSLGINVAASRLVSGGSLSPHGDQQSPRSPGGLPSPRVSSRQSSNAVTGTDTLSPSSASPSSRPSLPASSAPPSRRPSQIRGESASSAASMQRHWSDSGGPVAGPSARSRSNTLASSSSGQQHQLTPAAALAAAVQQRSSSGNSNGNGTHALSNKTSRSSLRSLPAGSSPKVPPPPIPTTETRIFIEDHTKRIKVPVSAITTCAEVVALAKKAGVLAFGTDAEGGFALWECCRVIGVERPIREYEFVNDVVKSWEYDTNILIIKRTPLWPLLSSHLRTQPSLTRGGFVQLELKKGKWSKRYLELKDGVVTHAKSEKNKDASILCQLSNYEVYFVHGPALEALRAPKPYAFALKSKLPRVHYEDQDQYMFFTSVKTSEEVTVWVRALLEARNPIVRKQNSAVLSASSATSSPNLATQTTATMPARPLLADVDLPHPSAPLSRKSTTASASRGMPAVLLAQPPNMPLPADPQQRNTPSLDRPDPRMWANMVDQDRQRWLKEAQREAKEEGQTLVDLAR